MNVNSTYFRGYEPSNPVIQFLADDASPAEGKELKHIHVSGNWIADAQAAAISVHNVQGLCLHGNLIMNDGVVAPSNINTHIDLATCTTFSCTGNAARKGVANAYYGLTIASDCNNFTVVGNTFYGAVNIQNILDSSPSTASKSVIGNA